MVRRFKTLLAPLVALLLVLAACGDDPAPSATPDPTPENATEAILAAFSSVDPTAVDLTFSIDATGADLAEAFESEFSGDPSEELILDLLTKAEVQMVSSARAMSLALSLDGSPLGEFRVIDQTLYVRLDVDTVVKLVGDIEPEAAAELEETIKMAPMMFGDDPQMSFLGDLITGGWVSLELPADSELGDLWESNTDPEALNADFAEALEQIVDENTVVTPAGEARGGDRYLVEVNVADILTALQSHPVTAEALELSGSEADLEETLAEMRADGVAEVWELDVVLIDGKLSSMRIDFASISTEAPEGSTFPILITLGTSPSAPTAPSEHTPVPAELLNDLTSGFDMAA